MNGYPQGVKTMVNRRNSFIGSMRNKHGTGGGGGHDYFLPIGPDTEDSPDEAAAFARLADAVRSAVVADFGAAQLSQRDRLGKSAALAETKPRCPAALELVPSILYRAEDMVVGLQEWANPANLLLMYPHWNDAAYVDLVATTEHHNFVGIDAALGPVVVTVAHHPWADEDYVRCIFWSERGLVPFALSLALLGQSDTRTKLRIVANLCETHFGVSPTTKLQLAKRDTRPELETLERSLHSVNYKFGLLYAKQGQSQNDMFGNVDGSPAFDRFLELLGSRVDLLGWAGFRGGLDVKHGHTGLHSVYTDFDMGMEGRGPLTFHVMWHISTWLPHSERDAQQLERKRHLGNDIVVVIFLDGEEGLPFDPTLIKSEFNHVFIVVQPVAAHGGYQVSTIYKSGVELCNPLTPAPGVFQHGSTFRDWLLAKCINAERVSYECKTFSQKLRRTRKAQLQLLVNGALEDPVANVSAKELLAAPLEPSALTYLSAPNLADFKE